MGFSKIITIAKEISIFLLKFPVRKFFVSFRPVLNYIIHMIWI